MVWVHKGYLGVHEFCVRSSPSDQNPRNAISTWACTKHRSESRIVRSCLKHSSFGRFLFRGHGFFWPLNKAVPATGGVVLGGVQVGPFDSHDYSWMMITLLWHFGKVQVKWISFLQFICWDELCKRWFFNPVLAPKLGVAWSNWTNICCSTTK